MKRGPGNTFSNDVIRASAGTGKTYRLSNRYLQLLAAGVPCENILATTFTRKGAGEILDRIIQRLAEAALDATAAETLAKALGVDFDTSRAQSMLAGLMVNLHRLQIGTLDGFFSRIAQSFSLELALPSDWTIVQEQEMDLLRDRAIQQVLRGDSVLQLVRLMNKGEAQRRVSELIRLTVRALYHVYLDSEPTAWNQIPPCKTYLGEEELDQIVGQLEGLEAIDFPHSRQKAQLQKEIAYVVNRDWDGLVQSKMFASVVSGECSYYKPLPPELVALYACLVPHCRAYVVSRLIQQNVSTFELLQEYSRRFEQLKTVEGQLRFDDITQRLVRYVATREMRAMAFRMDHRIHHLLLDEFQDTSPSQWAVIKPFALRAAEEGDDRSFFCVGDTKQAIFGWRGGLAEIFDVVTAQLGNVNDKEKLSVSYRSSPIVIDMVNSVFSQLGKLEFKKPQVQSGVRQWQDRFETHETAKQDLSGYVTMEYAPDAEGAENRWEKAALRNENVIRRTVELISDLSSRHAEDEELTIGVLVRKNESVGQLIFGLQQAGIPASEEGGNPLTDSAAVELILSAVQLIDHPSDSIARYHVSHSPLAMQFGLEPEVPANQKTNAEAAVLSANPLRASLLSRGYGPTVESFAGDLLDRCTRRELMRLQQLVQEAFNYDDQVRGERSRTRADQFVAYMRNEFRAQDRSSAKIRVMTVHQSKGLEFDIVVLPFQSSSQGWLTHRPDVVVDRESPTEPVSTACRWMSEKEREYLAEPFPSMFEEEREGEVRESLSVLYVALTRAVRAVHMIISRNAKPSDASDEGVLLSTLGASADPGEAGADLIYEQGDPKWYEDDGEQDSASSTMEVGLNDFYLPLDDSLATVSLDQEIRSGRGLVRTSPSSLEGGSRVSLKSVFSVRDQQEALLHGSLIHACFEQVFWLEEFEFDRQALLERAKRVDPSSVACGEAVRDFEQMLEADAVQDLLSRDRYQQKFLSQSLHDQSVATDAIRMEVQNERPFAVFLDGQLVQGVIDRLVLIYEGADLVAADLIDFKTDRVAEGGLVQRVEYYRPQLNAYRKAVSRFCRLPVERVTTRLLFVAANRRFDLEFSEEEKTVRPGVPLDAADPSHGSPLENIGVPKPAQAARVNKVERPTENRADSSGQMKLWDDD